MKMQIFATLGEQGLQRAGALNAGLAANDRLRAGQLAVKIERPEAALAAIASWRLAAELHGRGQDQGADCVTALTSINSVFDLGRAAPS
jgi:hypothetical protein